MRHRKDDRIPDEITLRTAARAPLVSDLRLDLNSSNETLFMMLELSDAMRRGVRHYRADGTPLLRLNNVIEALIFDGEVFYDDAPSARPPGH